MSRPFNDVYVNVILNVCLDTTPAYVLSDGIGVVDSLVTNLAFWVKSMLTSKIEAAVKVTMPWDNLRILLLNVKGQSNIFHLFPCSVFPERIVVSIIKFIWMGDVPWYLEAILVGNLLHSRLHIGGHFIFLLQSEWDPSYECRFVYQLIIFLILCSLDSMWFLYLPQWNPWVCPTLPLYLQVTSFGSLFTISVSVSWYRKRFTLWQ